MKEHPILFQDRLVRGILENRKTQTRRLIRDVNRVEPALGRILAAELCPYGQPGDRLWVREAWANVHGILRYRSDWEKDDSGERNGWWGPKATFIAADIKWKPSIHLPRLGARILLEIVSVRVQRLQEISEEDAIAEGVPRAHPWRDEGEAPCGDGPCGGWEHPNGIHMDSARGVFRDLWDSINGKRPGASWKENPWVWCIEFKLVTP